jgi:hypothetical protein
MDGRFDVYDYGGTLGRAIRRTQRALAVGRKCAPARAAPVAGAPSPRRFSVRGPGPPRWVVAAAAVAGVALAAAIASGAPAGDDWAWPTTLYVVALCAAAVALVWSLSPRHVVVGVDGIRVGRRFIPYSQIVAVHHECSEGRAFSSEHDDVGHAVYRWSVGVSLDGELVRLDAATVTSPDGVAGAELADAIEGALSAWRVRQTAGAGTLARGGRSAGDWLGALRDLGSGACNGYRRAAPDLGGLRRLLEDPWAKPSTRAAAAIALSAGGDAAAPLALWRAAEAVLDERLRVAFERVVDATTDDEVAEALDALEEAERRAGVASGA